MTQNPQTSDLKITLSNKNPSVKFIPALKAFISSEEAECGISNFMTYGFTKSTIREAFDHYIDHHGTESLSFIYSAVVAGGTKPVITNGEAGDIRDRLILSEGSFDNFYFDEYLKSSIESHIDRLIVIFREIEIYGVQDASRQLKEIAADLIVLKSNLDNGEVSETIDTDLAQPLLSIARKAYLNFEIFHKLLTAASALKNLLPPEMPSL